MPSAPNISTLELSTNLLTQGAAITIVTLAAKDQFALGTSAGVAGSIRFLISSIASTV